MIITITIFCGIVYEDKMILKIRSSHSSENIRYNHLNATNLKHFANV